MRFAGWILGGVLAALAGGAQAASLDFSGLKDGELPGQFYAGGAGSDGSVGGPGRDFGVTFTNALVRCNLALDCDRTEQNVLVFTDRIAFAPPAAAFDVNVARGFEGDLAFNFATTQGGEAELWSGVGGAGRRLGIIDLAAGGCPEPGPHCSFRNTGLRLDAGEVAHSITFTGVSPGFFAIDNLVLNLAGPATAAPEPAGWALMMLGFGLAGAGVRGRRACAA